MIPKLYIARTADGNGFPLPTYDSKYHVGLNLQAAIGTPLKINPGERIRIPVGFAIGIPQGFCGQIVSHPYMAENFGIVVPDAPHVVNPTDRSPLFVSLQNISHHQVILHRGDIIVQLLVFPVVQVAWNEVKTEMIGTKTENIIIEEGQDIAPKSAKNLFFSPRREKKSLRDRYHKQEKNEK